MGSPLAGSTEGGSLEADAHKHTHASGARGRAGGCFMVETLTAEAAHRKKGPRAAAFCALLIVPARVEASHEWGLGCVAASPTRSRSSQQ